MIKSHNLGFPRIGKDRELKKAVEAFWHGQINETRLQQIARELRRTHWQLQQAAGLDLIPVGDFSFYDQVLDMSCTLGAIPARFKRDEDNISLSTYFDIARGCTPCCGAPIHASEMTKWFDTNYHYIVPEVHQQQTFKLSSTKLFDEVDEALALGVAAKPVILGPLSWLWLAKIKGETFDKLQLLEQLLPVYQQLLNKLAQQGVEWIQIDEPILVLDLPADWQNAFTTTYRRLQLTSVKYLLATYFGDLGNNLQLACQLAVAGLHIDVVRGAPQLQTLLQKLPATKTLSLGIINGRNIWRADLDTLLDLLQTTRAQTSRELWIAPSCSLLHVPVDLHNEHKLDTELKSWLAFAAQKLDELDTLKTALNISPEYVSSKLADSRLVLNNKQHSARIHHDAVKQRINNIRTDMLERNLPYAVRSRLQKEWLNLPVFPTTTIGSFPQTSQIRELRKSFKQETISSETYVAGIKNEIADIVKKQLELGLDVLVHGEPERNDMVEYFGEQLEGFAFTQNGWVQSYGSRCVKPPIIYGDVSRKQAMTVDWICYAQSCTDKPMKGMLTGPVTMLNWSFVRNDQPRATTAMQIALALRDEVQDLEAAGIKIIQIDEAALREKLPLRKSEWQAYLEWAVRAFRITASVVAADTQIHTHMCYSEFNDIIQAIADMDADVITIETSRSDMELLDAFENYHYPNEIGPGVYDIHSPNVPTQQQIVNLMKKAAQRIPVERLWINPDCGLKTRQWPEVEQALRCMVESAKQLRREQLTD